MTVGQRCHIEIAAGTVGVDLGDDCIIDKTIIIAPDTPIDLVEENRRIQAWRFPDATGCTSTAIPTMLRCVCAPAMATLRNL